MRSGLVVFLLIPAACVVRATPRQDCPTAGGRIAVAPAPPPLPMPAPPPSPSPGPVAPSALGPLDCTSEQPLVIEHQTIRADDLAIDAHQGCNLTIRSSHIIARLPLHVHGHARVTIEDSVIEGAATAIDLHGDARLSARRTTIIGAVDRHGFGSMTNFEGVVHQPSTAPALAAPPARASGPAVVVYRGGLKSPVECGQDQTMVVEGHSLLGGLTTIEAYGNCQLIVRNTHIGAGATALDVHGNARVTVESSSLDTYGYRVLSLAGQSQISFQNTSVRGSIERLGSAQIIDLGGNSLP